jgi:hypothetical protein
VRAGAFRGSRFFFANRRAGKVGKAAKACLLKQRAGVGLLCHTYDEERAGKEQGHEQGHMGT